MEIKIFSYMFILHLCLTTLQGAFCDDDLKMEFGKKLGASMENSGLEFFQTAIRTVDNLFNTILREASPTAQQIKEIKQHKIELNEIRTKIQGGITDPKKFVQIINNFLTSKYIRLIKLDQQSIEEYNENQRPFVLEAIRQASSIMEESSKKFAMSVYNKWTELYYSLPKSELDKHSEYEQINELMQGVSRTEGRGSEFLDVIRSLINFFDCEEWMFILNLSETQENNTE